MNLADMAAKRNVFAATGTGTPAGAWAWASRLLELLPDEMPRVIVDVDDFGIDSGESGQDYLSALSRALTAMDACVLFVEGNHEDHARLRARRQARSWRARRDLQAHLAAAARPALDVARPDVARARCGGLSGQGVPPVRRHLGYSRRPES